MKNNQILETDGLYLRGTVISSNARAFKNKDDGSVSVMISHDVAYDGQVLSWTQYVKPHEDEAIKMAGMDVLEFPHFENFKPILLKVRRSKVYQGRLNVTLAEVLDLTAA